ncbi:MAG TPA: ferritin-like domain-containing protein [Gaiellaceae bacterium]|jgi:rubrerythrin|nr:ferritin-like domain-containing protein [Gaiellaceae bacterium]
MPYMQDEVAADAAAVDPALQSRRGFLTKALMLGGGALAASGVGVFAGVARGAPSVAGDVAILNFALKLEYLEAAFYERAANGAYGRLAPPVQQLAETLAEHEQEHVDALVATIPKLGGHPVAKPGLKIPPLDQRTFLRTAIALEGTGVGAYGGAFPMLKLEPVKEAALAIHSVEARHHAWARRLAGVSPAPDAFYHDLTEADVLRRAQPFFA